MNTPLISVIVPCYNAENYIDKCINSLVTQTIGIDRLELILVNDASPDRTYEKLLAWEQKYPDSVMVISYEENLRQGGARNIGIQYASADWIGFVDSDDWCEPDMYETLYQYAKTDKYDVIRGKYIRDKGNADIQSISKPRRDCEYFFQQNAGYYVPRFEDTGNNGSIGGIVTGLYRKDLILNNNLWFPEHLIYEDNYWSNILYLYTSGIYIVDKIIYHYFVNPDSTTLKRNNFDLFHRLDIEIMILEKYKELGIFDLYYEELETNFLERYFCNTWFMIFSRFDTIPHILMHMKKVVLYYFPDYRKNAKINAEGSFTAEVIKLLDFTEEPDDEMWDILKTAYLSIAI